jgi:glutathione S-transferase
VGQLTLHDFELDEGCYKVKLLLGALGLPFRKVDVNVFPGREQQSQHYLRLNPLGQLPILTDGELVLRGAEAILAYLAHRYDHAKAWLPDDPEIFGQVMSWLSFAGIELRPAALARLHSIFEVELDGAAAAGAARRAFRIMDDHMTKREFGDSRWFAGGGPSIADIALYPAIALSRDFDIEHDEFPALRRWMRRIRGIPGFVTMPGIPAYH